jgi:hypothetical protein
LSVTKLPGLTVPPMADLLSDSDDGAANQLQINSKYAARFEERKKKEAANRSTSPTAAVSWLFQLTLQ